MRTIIVLLILFLSILSCNKPNNKQGNLLVKGKIKGLRLGTILLEKLDNDTIKSIDSIKVDGKENFEFNTTIKQPQVLTLSISEVKDSKINFFAAPNDTIQIYTFLETFALKPVIFGGKNQEKWQEYKDMLQKFTDKEMDMFKAEFDASKKNQTKLSDSLKAAFNRLLKKKQLYKLNYIFLNKNLPISAYLGLTEFYNNEKALDTIYKILPENIKKTKYGKKIEKILKK